MSGSDSVLAARLANYANTGKRTVQWRASSALWPSSPALTRQSARYRVQTRHRVGTVPRSCVRLCSKLVCSTHTCTGPERVECWAAVLAILIQKKNCNHLLQSVLFIRSHFIEGKSCFDEMGNYLDCDKSSKRDGVESPEKKAQNAGTRLSPFRLHVLVHVPIMFHVCFMLQLSTLVPIRKH